MCGACAGMTLDWAGPLVSGPLRRRDVADHLTRLCPNLTVRPVTRGWTIARKTGAVAVAMTFDDLLGHVAGHSRCNDWEDLEKMLAEVETSRRVETPKGGDWPVGPAPGAARPVLESVVHLPDHVKLAAFGLGVRVCGPGRVTATFSGHRLVAQHGVILRGDS